MFEFPHRIENITPTKAAIYLQHNIINRPLHPSWVDSLAYDMTADRWRLTHQGIALDKNGILVDGQHRLLAIIKSGITIRSIVFLDVPAALFDIIDHTLPRSSSDCLVIKKMPYSIAKIISAAVPFCITYDNGNKPTRALVRMGNRNIVVRSYSDKNPLLQISAEIAKKYKTHDAVIASAITCFTHFQINKINNDADDFIDALMTGIGVAGNTVLYVLRKQLIASRMGTLILREEVKVQRIIATYKAFHSNKIYKDPRQILNSIDSSISLRFS